MIGITRYTTRSSLKESMQELNKKEYKDLFIDNRRLCTEKVLLRRRLCTFPYDKEVDTIVNEFLINNLQYNLKDLCIEVEHSPENELLWCNGYILKFLSRFLKKEVFTKRELFLQKNYFTTR